MATNIYVGNLSFKTTETELKELFSQYGQVTKVNIIQDRENGRSRGFGFVEMESDNVNDAITAIDGSEFGGRNLRVNVAREKARRPNKKPRNQKTEDAYEE